LTDELERLKTALADTYAVESELGAGGMATVYLAKDLKHDRLVAVKVLRPELAASLGTERFLREIQVTAKLTHPHILPLYDSGEADGFLYYVMPYVEGESLADMIHREQQLSLHDAVRITREAASALAYAHSYGLVHRDIKPANIMLSGGHAVVADFGIARAVSEAGGEKITQTGMAVGTPAYMSPEQAAGDERLDGRSDIYALGCVLYEMLVGQAPFTGPNAQAIIARHAMDQVTSPAIMRQSIPAELEEIIFLALEKAPADRYRTANEFEEALNMLDSGTVPMRRASRAMSSPTLQRRTRRTSRRGVWIAASAVVVVGVALAGWQLFLRGPGAGTTAGGLDPKRIAVLYFEDLSPAENLGYVTDGLTEELIARLSLVQSLEVVSRNGAAQFRDSDASRDSIARALEAGTLIDGSVMPVGNRLRITLFLVDGASGADFDRASFEIPASEFLAMQDSVTDEISGLLRERLGEEIELRERRAATSSVEAWGMVQQAERLRKDGEALLETDDVDGAFASFNRADSILALAEAADAEWAEPIVLRSRIAYRRSRLASDMPEAEHWIGAGMGHAERVLARDEGSGEALELRGTLQYWGWIIGIEPDPDAADDLLNAARADLEAAVQIDPSLAGAYSTLSHLYYQFDDDVPGALRAAQRAYREDAYLAVANQVLWRLFLGSFDLELLTQARQWCNEGYQRFPDDYRFTECQLWVMTTPLVEPDVDEAWRLNAQMVELTPEPDREHQQHRGQMIVGGILARAELADSARRVLVRARGGFELDPDQSLTFIEAYIRTLLGDYDESVQLLERFTAGSADPADVLAPDYWWWRDLQDHPGFRDLVGSSN